MLIENLSEGRVPGQSRELDFTLWAGAYNRVPVEATAFAHRDARFLLLHVAVVEPGNYTPRAAGSGSGKSVRKRSTSLLSPSILISPEFNASSSSRSW